MNAVNFGFALTTTADILRLLMSKVIFHYGSKSTEYSPELFDEAATIIDDAVTGDKDEDICAVFYLYEDVEHPTRTITVEPLGTKYEALIERTMFKLRGLITGRYHAGSEYMLFCARLGSKYDQITWSSATMKKVDATKDALVSEGRLPEDIKYTIVGD